MASTRDLRYNGLFKLTFSTILGQWLSHDGVGYGQRVAIVQQQRLQYYLHGFINTSTTYGLRVS